MALHLRIDMFIYYISIYIIFNIMYMLLYGKLFGISHSPHLENCVWEISMGIERSIRIEE